MINPTRFIIETEQSFHQDNQGQRKGQFYYNRFRELFPKMKIPDHVDCFYDDRKLKDFVEFIYGMTP